MTKLLGGKWTDPLSSQKRSSCSDDWENEDKFSVQTGESKGYFAKSFIPQSTVTSACTLNSK